MKVTNDFVKENKITIILVTLLVLVMISFSIIGNMLAKYKTDSDAVDIARVAKFNISETGITEIAVSSDKFYPGYTLIQPIEINNKSEVAIDYTLTVEIITNNLPLVLNMNDTEGRVITVNKQLQPNSGEEEYSLSITWPAELNSVDYSMMVDVVKLTVNAVQLN